MAATVTSQIRVLLNSTLANTLGVATGSAVLEKAFLKNLASGTGADQADKVYTEQKTISASGTYDLDLAGALTDAFGVALTFARVKLIAVFAATGNTNNVLIGNAAATQFLGPMGAAAHTVSVMPGGVALFGSFGATAWAVAAGSADLLRFTNSGAGTSVTFDLVVLGASA